MKSKDALRLKITDETNLVHFHDGETKQQCDTLRESSKNSK